MFRISTLPLNRLQVDSLVTDTLLYASESDSAGCNGPLTAITGGRISLNEYVFTKN